MESKEVREKGIKRISKEKDFMYKMTSENRSWKEKRQGGFKIRVNKENGQIRTKNRKGEEKI